jgi:hypothetical protein
MQVARTEDLRVARQTRETERHTIDATPKRQIYGLTQRSSTN